MCSGILFVGLLAALLDGDLHLGVPPAVVLGGALWALSNFVPRFYFSERLTNTLSQCPSSTLPETNSKSH